LFPWLSRSERRWHRAVNRPSPVPFDSDSKATSSQDADLPSPRTLHDVSEVIRAHYRATAQLIEAVYLR